MPDIRDEPPSQAREIAMRAGFRARLVVPLIAKERVVGALVIRRNFRKGAIHLLQTFAAQSVLAIQNARLFREIEEKGRQLQQASEHKSQFVASMSAAAKPTPPTATAPFPRDSARSRTAENVRQMAATRQRRIGFQQLHSPLRPETVAAA
jgi:GAF domain-containing protein